MTSIHPVLAVAVVLFLIFILVYVGYKIRRAIFIKFNKGSKLLFWLSYSIMFGLFVINLSIRAFINDNGFIMVFFKYSAAVFIGLLLYGAILFMVADLIKLLLKLALKIRKNSFFIKRTYSILSKVYQSGFAVLLIVAIIVGYGIINTHVYSVREYTLSSEKRAVNEKSLDIVMLADLHLGNATGKNSLDRIVRMINGINPEIIFLCGDIFDEGTSDALLSYAKKSFSEMKTVYGIYYVVGNHERMLGGEEKYTESMKNCGVTVLEDETVLINDSFYVVGRRDKSNKKRAPLEELLKDTDKTLPIIVLDHQPSTYEEAAECGADLQLSGHTHAGQLFPVNFLSLAVNGINYGLRSVDDFDVIVTSGISIWGFPIRVGSLSEAVHIKYDFK